MADLPIAAIVCIAVGCYVAVIIAILIICNVLKGRGQCGESHCCAKDENAQSCQCCISIAESCNCCKGPSVNSCLDACCNRKRISCVDILMCKCCSSDGSSWIDVSSCGSWTVAVVLLIALSSFQILFLKFSNCCFPSSS